MDSTADCGSPLSEELLVPCIQRREKVAQYKQFSEYSSSETAVEWHVATKAPLIDCTSTVKSNFAAQEDQATEAIVDMALKYRKPFAVVPCCVFSHENPHRRLKGKPE